jgi:hypothetical protein
MRELDFLRRLDRKLNGKNLRPPIRWEFFFGACFLTAALLLPQTSPLPVVIGMAFAAVIVVAWRRIRRRP